MYRFFKKYFRTFFVLLLTITTSHTAIVAQPPIPDYSRLLNIPKQYSILNSTERIVIDGSDHDHDWSRAPWTSYFSDITTGAAAEKNKQARCKMLWDSLFLYVYAEFQEQDIWASIRQPDVAVFQDNAFEIFINPDGSNYNYFEFQINAFETTADLFLPRPYRNGGYPLGSWDINGLEKAIRINGTLNNNADIDSGWSIELAIPFSALGIRKNMIKTGTIWRMNFSRVQWQLDKADNGYVRKRTQTTGRPLPEHYDVWSPQGLVNLHYPERWGYVMFADTLPPGGFLNEKTERLKLTMWKYYYLQQQYHRENGQYASDLTKLDKLATGLPDTRVSGATVQLYANEQQFYIQGTLPGSHENMTVDHKGEFRIQRR
ncbi:MAG TPA: carbohydrate-binding family 9-like protein [Agriterribacter sp.]|nr:carbohydrate-binding family 9-like protein [Agriterribacter sp.]